MAAPLKSRQAQLAREAILEALASRIAETGSLDFSIADIAADAGVSLRTVYNHFGDRQGLIDAFAEYATAEMRRRGATPIPESLTDLPGVIAANYESMTEVAALTEALARIDHVQASYARHAEVTRVVADRVSRRYPWLSEREVASVAAIIRQVVGTQPWYRLTREHELSAGEAASAVAWTLRLMIEALDRGQRPLQDDEPD